jgi:hypothetical protein
MKTNILTAKSLTRQSRNREWSADIPVRLGRGSTTEADKNVRAPFRNKFYAGCEEFRDCSAKKTENACLYISAFSAFSAVKSSAVKSSVSKC